MLRRPGGLSLSLVAMHWAELLCIPVNSSVHSDCVYKGIYTISIHLVVGMREVKERVCFPLHELCRHVESMQDFLMVPYQCTK